MHAVFPAIEPASYASHILHSPERMWPETNCFVDLWIELVSTTGLIPEAMLGFTLTQDFEGDQFTFFKTPFEDLESLYGIRCQELAIFDDVEVHAETQISRGRLPMFTVPRCRPGILSRIVSLARPRFGFSTRITKIMVGKVCIRWWRWYVTTCHFWSTRSGCS